MNQPTTLIIHAPFDLSEEEAVEVQATFHDLCIAEDVEASFHILQNGDAGFAVFPAWSPEMDLDLTYRLVRSLQTLGQRWF